MLQSSLTHADEHFAWQQRVRKELGNTNKFYNVAMQHVEGQPAFNGTNVLRPYQRHNRDHFVAKTTPYYMLDSSYLVPSDPNTVRDNGPCRNAEYAFHQSRPDLGARTLSGDRLMRTWSTLRSGQQRAEPAKNAVYSVVKSPNKSLYRFGGTTKIAAAVAPGSKQHQSEQLPGDNVGQVQIVRVNDYTKNISQTIFSPGLSKATSQPAVILSRRKAQQQPEGQPVRRSLLRELSPTPMSKA